MTADEKRAGLAERAAALGIVGRCSSCGELWPSCKCGTRKPSSGPFVEWVQWQVGRHLWEKSRSHVRLNTGGSLLCGRRSPPTAPASSSSTPPADACRVCLLKLPEYARRSGLA